MTISSTVTTSGPYACNGSQAVFSYGFKIFDDDDLAVVLTDSLGAETVLTKTTHYTVSGVGDDNGGDVTTIATYASGNTITIDLSVPMTQEASLSNQGSILPAVIERALDYMAQAILQLSSGISRSMRAPVSDGSLDMTLPTAALRAGKYAGYDANGLPTAISGSVSEVPVTSFMEAVLAAGTAVAAQDALGLLGEQTIFVPASAMTARSTNGAAAATAETSTNKVMVASFNFDQTTQEYAQFSIAMPTSWDEGTFDAEIIWSDGVGSGDVVWGLQALSLSNADALDAAFGTAVEVTDTTNGSGDQNVAPATGAITPSGTPAAGDVVIFQIYRKAADGADTLAGDAQLLGVRLKYSIEAMTD